MKKFFVVSIVLLISLELEAQKRLDTLNIDQLNTYKHNAVKLRNAGRTATLFGLGFFVAGGTTSLALSTGKRGRENYGMGIVPLMVGAGILTPCALVGVPLWVTGAKRKKKAEIAIQKFNYTPENSQSLGLRLTVMF